MKDDVSYAGEIRSEEDVGIQGYDEILHPHKTIDGIQQFFCYRNCFAKAWI